ncbi:aryl-alcohol dehydrogenase [Basidiobolus ranarum]|uniref:Aryl-alcohol dehydrogenase n=1 Tax=Basidiobolus ranarum TaxID=34480 RepID=A0ABR2WCN7_9FUNG
MRRDFEREIIPMACHFGMALAPWDVLGGGTLKTKAEIAERKKKREGLRSIFRKEQSEEGARISEALEKVALEQGVKSITPIAIAYVMAKAPHVFPLVADK